MEIIVNRNVDAITLNDHLKRTVGADHVGIVKNSVQLRVVLNDDAPEFASKQSVVQAIVDSAESLTLATDKSVISADGVDVATITLALDETIDWRCTLDGDYYSSGEEAAVGGVISLELDTEYPGLYKVYVMRRGGNYASGVVTIAAS